MRIYLIDDKMITKYDLPATVEEDYLINYKNPINNETSTITILANDKNWVLKSNGSVNILNKNAIIDEIKLEKYSYHNLKFVGTTYTIILFCMPIYDKNSFPLSYNTNTNTTIKIGSKSDNHIKYNHPQVKELEAVIIYNEGNYYIQASENSNVYLNDQKCQNNILNYGDIIFIWGLKIIWMAGFIKINNPQNKLTTTSLSNYTLPKTNNQISSDINEEENNIELYTNEEYFYHIPRLKATSNPEKIKVDVPPEKQIKDDIPFILSMGTSITLLGASCMMGFNVANSIMEHRGKMQIIPQVIMVVALLLGSLVMPRILQVYKNKMVEKKEQKRIASYKAYIKQKREKINQLMKEEASVIYENNPSTLECYEKAIKSGAGAWHRNLWNREISDDDFLTARLGLGNTESLIEVEEPEEKFTVEEDELLTLVKDLASSSKIITQVPILFSFKNHPNTSVIFNYTEKNNYINCLLTQILTNHSPEDLKVVILTNKENEYFWEYIKIVPHIWDADKKIRFFASTPEEHLEVATYLEEIYKDRVENKDIEISPYYLIITDNYLNIKNLGIIDTIIENTDTKGFSLLTLSETMKNMPNKCEWFIQIGQTTSCILRKELNHQNQQVFVNEVVNINMNNLAIKLANIPTESGESASSLPTSLAFLEMYNASKIEQLNIKSRWETNNPVVSLQAPVGVHVNKETFKLDLHEKYHGPHGLIAGATGSGKSEFIITYILSMAINYHPNEVEFVLIDYKGGGLAGAFENKETKIKLPHLVGTITNLDTSEMNRTLISLESELKRRQRKFNEVRDSLGEGTIDIYKYQRLYREGVIKEPMSHLFIISDEFAELKAQEPEFMAQLISISRIGRSLGVHLILATQKPAGVVNDQIWSNSKFKVCLKVQTKEDSNEMLKRPDAASLKEVGRFYLQVGYNDYFDIGQSGWSGAKYIPTNKIIKKTDDSINFINNIGLTIKTINELPQKGHQNEYGDQLTNIVKYIYNIAQKDGIIKQNLWLDKIPEIIYLNEIKQKYNYTPKHYHINPLIGEYDNPALQEQKPLNIDLTNGGNIIIYGKTGSGKEKLLQTLIFSSIVEHTPSEVNIYAVDCGAETLGIFNNIPHIGKIANTNDNTEIKDILEYATKQLEKRKELFSNYAGSYINYITTSGQSLPLLVFIINGYETFSELYSSESEELVSIYRECKKYGIIFILTATAASNIRTKVSSSFDNIICLQLNDESDYMYLLNAERGQVPAKMYGRGLIKINKNILEFQTITICDTKDFSTLIKKAELEMNKAYTEHAEKIVSIPKILTLKNMTISNYNLKAIPVGYDITTKNIATYDFTKDNITVIATNDIEESQKFIPALFKLLKQLPNNEVAIIDFLSLLNTTIKTYTTDFIPLLENITKMIEYDTQINKNYTYILVAFRPTKIEETISKKYTTLMKNLKQLKNNHFIIYDDITNLNNIKYEEWFKSNTNKTNGIYLGSNINDQNIITTEIISLSERKNTFPQQGYIITNSKLKTIKYVIDEGDESEE